MSTKHETISLLFDINKTGNTVSVPGFLFEYSVRLSCTAAAAQTKQVREHFSLKNRSPWHSRAPVLCPPSLYGCHVTANQRSH